MENEQMLHEDVLYWKQKRIEEALAKELRDKKRAEILAYKAKQPTEEESAAELLAQAQAHKQPPVYRQDPDKVLYYQMKKKEREEQERQRIQEELQKKQLLKEEIVNKEKIAIQARIQEKMRREKQEEEERKLNELAIQKEQYRVSEYGIVLVCNYMYVVLGTIISSTSLITTPTPASC